MILLFTSSWASNNDDDDDIEECDLSHANANTASYTTLGINEWLLYRRDLSSDPSGDLNLKPCEFNLDINTETNDPKPFAYYQGEHSNITTDFYYNFSLKNLSSTLNNLEPNQYIKFLSIDTGIAGFRAVVELFSLEIREYDSNTWEVSIFWHGHNRFSPPTTFELSKQSDDVVLQFSWHKAIDSNVPEISLDLDGENIFQKNIYIKQKPHTSRIGLINSNEPLNIGNAMYFGPF